MAARGVIPRNTEASTQWALRNFIAWAKNREACTQVVIVVCDGNSSRRWGALPSYNNT